MRSSSAAGVRALKLHLQIILALLVSSIVGCSKPDAQSGLDVLRVAVLPDREPQELAQRYSGLLEHLEGELGVDCDLIIPGSYYELVEAMIKGRVHLAHLGGVTFVHASDHAGAVPLVMRGIDQKFTSYFLVRAEEPAQSLREMRGRRIGFGDMYSTSGHLMPRYFLRQMNIQPETFFSEVRHSRAHDMTALWVQEGKIDVAVVNAVVARKMFADGRLDTNRVRILWETPYYANYVWAVHPSVSQNMRNRLRDAFMALSADNPGHAAILAALSADIYLPAGPGDYLALRTIMEERRLVHNGEASVQTDSSEL